MKKLLCVLMILLTLAAYTLVAMGSEESDDGDSSTTEQGENSSSENSNKINDTVTVGDFEFKVTTVYDATRLGTPSLNMTTEANFAIVTVVIKNIDNSENTITSSSVTYHIGNNKYETTSGASLYVDKAFDIIETIGADLQKTIVFVYEIPRKHSKTDYILVKDGFKSAKIYLE